MWLPVGIFRRKKIDGESNTACYNHTLILQFYYTGLDSCQFNKMLVLFFIGIYYPKNNWSWLVVQSITLFTATWTGQPGPWWRRESSKKWESQKRESSSKFLHKTIQKKCIVIQICIMNQFNPTTFLCLSQAMNWILIVIICHGLFVLNEFRFDDKWLFVLLILVELITITV